MSWIEKLNYKSKISIEKLNNIFNLHNLLCKIHENWILSGKLNIAETLVFDNSFDFVNYGLVKLSTPIDWKIQNNKDDNLNWQLHSFVMLPHLANAYKQTSNEAFIEFAKELVLNWEKANCKEPFPSRFSWNDHSTSNRLLNLSHFLVFLLQLSYDDKYFINKLMHLIYIHQDILTSNDFYTKGTNHGLFQSYNLYISSCLLSFVPNAEHIKQVSLKRLEYEIKNSFSEEWIHIENSPEYHGVIFGNIVNILNTIRQIENILVFGNMNDFINGALEYLSWIIRPDGCYPPIGDTEQKPPRNNLSSLREYEQYKYFEYAINKQHCNFLNWYKVYPISGYAIFRSRPDIDIGLHAVMKCGFLSYYHRQDDDNTIVLYAFSEDWLIDGGLYIHEHNDAQREHFRSHYAHNVLAPLTPVIERRNKNALLKEPCLYQIESSIDKIVVRGETYMYTNYFYTREIEYDGYKNFIVKDSIKSIYKKTQPYFQYWQISADKDVRIIDNECHIVSNKIDIKMIIKIISSSFVKMELLNDSNEFALSHYVSKSYGVLSPVNALRACFIGDNIEVITRIYFVKNERCYERECKAINTNSFKLSSMNLLDKATNTSKEEFKQKFTSPQFYDIDDFSSSDSILFQIARWFAEQQNNKMLFESYLQKKSLFCEIDNVKCYQHFSLVLQAGELCNWFVSNKFGFWLIQHHYHNLSLFFPQHSIYICLSSRTNKLMHTEALTELSSILFDIFDIYNIDVLFKKQTIPNDSIFLSYVRPYHYFYDLLLPVYKFFNEYPKEYFSNFITLKNGNFYPIEYLFKNINIQEYDSSHALNIYLLQSDTYLFKPVINALPNRTIGVNYHREVLGAVSQKHIYHLAFLSLMSFMQNSEMVLWIGVCSEKRSWLNKFDGICKIITCFKERFSTISIVLDGLTSTINENMDEFYNKAKVLKDMKLCDDITEEFPDVKIINSIGFKSHEKLFLAKKCDFFITNYLTDSMYVARFANKYGLAYGSNAGHYRQHLHPHTIIIPNKFINDDSLKAHNWTAVSYRIDPDFIADATLKVYLLSKKQIGCELFSGKGYYCEENMDDNSLKIISTVDKDTYLGIGEKFAGFDVQTDSAYIVIPNEQYIFRFEAFSEKQSRLFILGYANRQRVFTDRIAMSKSKIVIFPEHVTHFRLFLNLLEHDVVDFYDIHWNCFSAVGSVRLGGYIKLEERCYEKKP